MTPMEQLLTLLKAIEDTKSTTTEDDYIENQEASILACKALIDDEGNCIYKNHEVLKDAGFDVFPIERDRFGWLLGGIQTKKGIIIYG